MAKPKPRPAHDPARSDVDAALVAMSAVELREVVGELLRELDDRAFNRVASSLVSRAARNGSRWAPAPLSADEVAETLAFAEAAERVRHADPAEVDDALRRGSAAFLGKDYQAAYRILGALLRPIADGQLDLGQHELVDEVLGTDIIECSAQYVVAAYMISPPAERAGAVRAAIDEVNGVGHFWEPIGAMEAVALEPLPELEDFLRSWRELLGQTTAGGHVGSWDTEGEHWVREVVARLEGSDGLARLARATKRAGDLRAWCRSLVDGGDWKGALLAFDEAAGLLVSDDYARAELLDGAALAAQRLALDDLPARLERAWQASPSMLRLQRWLGSARGKTALRKRATEALEACPKRAARQRAFLHLLRGELEPSAKLLSAAPGLGWSDGEHPGHLLFPLFALLLGEAPEPSSRDGEPGGFEQLVAGTRTPGLGAPRPEELLRIAGIERIATAPARKSVVAAMRMAAERRIEGVTGQQRRRHYGHAADLVAVCVRCDPSPDTERWVGKLETEHRRFSALRRELDRALDAP